MAAFDELHWDHPDIYGIVIGRGIASVEDNEFPDCEKWLLAHGYRLLTLDFGDGISPVVKDLGHRLRWSEQFGYDLQADSRNLNALRDGFEFDIPDGGGLVLHLLSYEVAWTENVAWSRGFLAISAEHSLRQLALGKRFFTLICVSDANSPLVGKTVEKLGIPFPLRLGPGAWQE